jgi:membrane protein
MPPLATITTRSASVGIPSAPAIDPGSQEAPNRAHARPVAQEQATTRLEYWRKVVEDFVARDPLTLAASIAFYSALSFAPIVAISLWISARFSLGMEDKLIAQLGDLFGQSVHDLAWTVAHNNHATAAHMTPAAIVGLGVLLVSATTAFAQLQSAINLIFDATASRRSVLLVWLHRRLLSLGMLATLGFLLIITLVLSTVVSILLSGEGPLWLVMNEALTLMIFALAFSTLFRFVPDVRTGWKYALCGGGVTAILFECGKWLLGAWLAAATSTSAYGAGNAVVSLLLWVYYSALVVLVGAGLTHAIKGCFADSAPEAPRADAKCDGVLSSND